MEKTTGKRGTFVVQILDTQNASWQGKVNWIEEGESQPFRSALELIKLLDSAIAKEAKT